VCLGGKRTAIGQVEHTEQLKEDWG